MGQSSKHNISEFESTHLNLGRLVSPIRAVELIGRLRGGSQSHLFRCSDGNDYAVKFPNNPQGSKTLVCDLLGTLLATYLGLPTRPCCIVEIPQALVQQTDRLYIETANGREQICGGPCFGSQYPGSATAGSPFVASAVDFRPASGGASIRNFSDCAGILMFDQWTCNTDHRQLLFHRAPRARLWYMSMIDQGSCFSGAKWNFIDSPLWGLHQGLVSFLTQRFDVFEPWLDRLERSVNEKVLRSIAGNVRAEWYDGDDKALERLLEGLEFRKNRTRGLICDVARFVRDRFSHNTAYRQRGAGA